MTATPAATKVPARFATTRSKACPTDLLPASSNLVKGRPTLTPTTTPRTATGSATRVSSTVAWAPIVPLRRASTASGSCLASPRGTCGAVDWSKRQRLQKNNESLQLTCTVGLRPFFSFSLLRAYLPPTSMAWLIVLPFRCFFFFQFPRILSTSSTFFFLDRHVTSQSTRAQQ